MIMWYLKNMTQNNIFSHRQKTFSVWYFYAESIKKSVKKIKISLRTRTHAHTANDSPLNSELPHLKWLKKISKLDKSSLLAWFAHESRGCVWLGHESRIMIYIIYLSDK